MNALSLALILICRFVFLLCVLTFLIYLLLALLLVLFHFLLQSPAVLDSRFLCSCFAQLVEPRIFRFFRRFLPVLVNLLLNLRFFFQVVFLCFQILRGVFPTVCEINKCFLFKISTWEKCSSCSELCFLKESF